VGGGRGAFDGEDFPPKPPRMRWRTYRRLERHYEQLLDRWMVGVTVGTAKLLEHLHRGRKRNSMARATGLRSGSPTSCLLAQSVSGPIVCNP
jgi:hypothetical protein